MSKIKIAPTHPAQQEKTPPTDGVSAFVQSLISKGIVSRDLVEEALAWKKEQGIGERRHLFQILIEEFDADREQIYSEFARYYSFKVLDLAAVRLDSQKLQFINRTMDSLPSQIRELAEKIKILPFQISESDTSKICIVTPDPINPLITTVARLFPYTKHEVWYIALRHFEDLGRELMVEASGRPKQISTEFLDEEDQDLIEGLDEEIRKGHLQEVVDNVFTESVRINASDIHYVPKGPRKTEVHFRIDGHLNLWTTIDDIRFDAVCAVVKDLAKGTDRFERNMAQDGYAQKIIDGKLVRFRVSILPIVGREMRVKFESIVIRVLRDPETAITIENIGFHPDALAVFKKAIEKPYGMVILTGPTGSGKSTTLLAAIRAVMNPGLNILTVEDPVEYLIDGARQVKLNPKLDFEGALRAILRHDPDIVMVGEIRDKITADMAIKLANTGHLTFSTLHTNDAPGAIARLYKMGIEPFLLAYAVNIVVAQRLVRKLCEYCKSIDKEVLTPMLDKIAFPKDAVDSTIFYRPVGCIHCVGGYKGRTSIHEALYFTKDVRQLILEAGAAINEEAVRQIAIKQGMKTLRDSAIELVKKGVTTVEEIASTTVGD